MAKAPSSDLVMAPDKMKSLLAASKTEPVQAAIGLTSDGEGLLLLDKKAEPRKVLSMLRANAAKAKLQLNGGSLRFGRAEVDPEYDAGTVRLFINKDAPGAMRAKLVEVVKRIPYQKVEINVDPSLEAEAKDDAEAEESPAAAAPANDPEPPPADEATQLSHLLAMLIGRIQAVSGDDGRKAQLAHLASVANGLIKSGDFANARKALAGLGHAVSPAPAPAQAASPADLLALFRDAKEDVDSGITQLQAELRATDDVDLIRIADYGLYGMTNGEGVGLMKALLDLRGAPPDQIEPMTQAARDAAVAYKAAVFRHPLADLVDENPFGVTVGLRAKLGPALDRIAAA